MLMPLTEMENSGGEAGGGKKRNVMLSDPCERTDSEGSSEFID